MVVQVKLEEEAEYAEVRSAILGEAGRKMLISIIQLYSYPLHTSLLANCQ